MQYDLIGSKYMPSLCHYMGQKRKLFINTVNIMKYIVAFDYVIRFLQIEKGELFYNIMK